MLHEVAKAEFAVAVAGRIAQQAHAQLALAVVDQPLVGARLAALFVEQGVVPAREGAGVVGLAACARGPGQGVRAVVQLADDDGTVDVTVDEIHQHLGAGARCEHGAPVGAGLILQHAHPGAAARIARSVAGGLSRRGCWRCQAACQG